MDYKELMGIDIPVAAAIATYGNAMKIEMVNAEFVRLFGYTEQEIWQTGIEKLISGKDIYLLEETVAQAIRGKHAADQEVRIQHKDHTFFWVQVRCSLLAYKNALPQLIFLFWDIHEQKSGELEQRLLTQKYEMMEELSREYPFDLDVASWKMLRSHRLMELRGDFEAKDQYYPVDEEVKTLALADQDLFLKAMHEASQREMSASIDTRFNVCNEDEPPRYQWFRTYYRSVKDDAGEIVRIIGRSFNIDRDKALQEKVRRDPLTKLLNKMEIQREVTSYIEDNPTTTSIMFLIDIDNFKGINDNFGHTFGDTVLMDVANVIRSQFRVDDLVGRVGGDEFLVFMKNASVEKAQEKAEKLCSVLSREYSGENVNYRISSSIGLAVYRSTEDTYASMFEKADHAMYRAKQGGKDGYELASTADTGSMRNESINIDRREMINQKDQEFLAFAVSLMTHAKNLEGSLNMLLKKIADRYDLDFVAVFEEDEVEEHLTMTNYFARRKLITDNRIFAKMHMENVRIKPGQCVILTHEQLVNAGHVYPDEDGLEVKSNVSFSAVIGKFEYIGDRIGEVMYLTKNEQKQWTTSEIELFKELTRTMAIFVSLRFRVDESHAQIQNIQMRDQLTNLYNQESFRRQVAKVMAKADPDRIYAIEYLDINNFGYVNENYGYKVGDSILKMLAADVSSQPYFVVGCRLYSDFFLILTADENRELLEEHLRKRNQRFTNMQNHQYPNSGMGVTAGVYILENTKMDIDLAIENANLAWKHAKRAGARQIIFYTPDLRTLRVEEQKVVGEFFEALYRDDFQMYLQPKFLLGKEIIYGAEALARWKKQDGTIVPPAYFIDSLEKIGYITELDFYIFEEVLKTLDKWNRQRRRKIIVSTNFSGRHFEGNGEEFLNRIAHIMSKYTVLPSNIEIEVTEGILVKNVEVLKNCMNRLHEMGFRIAIDDFGTGYSSLSMLADMPADVIKIDKSFINVGMTDQKLKLLCEIGRMVKILGKDIIIEGVETKAQEQFLIDGGFECGQGFLCNRPVSLGEFERLYL